MRRVTQGEPPMSTPMPSLPMFYRQPRVLQPGLHGGFSLARTPDYGHAAQAHAVPLLAAEIPQRLPAHAGGLHDRPEPGAGGRAGAARRPQRLRVGRRPVARRLLHPGLCAPLPVHLRRRRGAPRAHAVHRRIGPVAGDRWRQPAVRRRRPAHGRDAQRPRVLPRLPGPPPADAGVLRRARRCQPADGSNAPTSRSTTGSG